MVTTTATLPVGPEVHTVTRTHQRRRPDPGMRQHGDPISKRPAERAFEVGGLVCGRCVGLLMDALLDVPGVGSVRVAPRYASTSTVQLSGSTADPVALSRAVRAAGFRPITTHPEQFG